MNKEKNGTYKKTMIVKLNNQQDTQTTRLQNHRIN